MQNIQFIDTVIVSQELHTKAHLIKCFEVYLKLININVTL